MDSSSVFQLPVEIIDEIAIHTSNLRDLMSLARTARTLYFNIVPRHLGRIRCDPYRLSVWKQLRSIPAICLRIRRLELILEVGPEKTTLPVILPGSLADDPSDLGGVPDECDYTRDYIALSAITDILGHLPNLARFSWSDQRHRKWDISCIFEALKKEPIQELQLDFYEIPREASRFHKLKPQMTFTNLSAFCLDIKLNHQEDEHQKMFDRICQMLVKECPGLQKLCLSLEYFNPYRYLRLSYSNFSRILEGKWPQLRNLTLNGAIDLFEDDEDEEKNTSIICNFFQTTVLLESLHLGVNIPKISSYDLLPNLSSLVLPDTTSPSRIVSPKMARRLRYLGTLNLGISPRRLGFPIPLLRSMTSLQSVAVTCPCEASIAKLSDAAPQLERIYFILSPDTENIDFKTAPSEELLSLLSRFPKLTHVGGTLVTFFEDDNDHLLDLFFQWIGSLQSIRYLEVFMDGTAKWVTLKRDTHGHYAGWEYTTDLTDVMFDDWVKTFWTVT